MFDETIVAEATAPGRAGVSVIRVSGSKAVEVAGNLNARNLKPRFAHRRTLQWQNDVIDDALVLWFAEPASFTGEDVVEFHVHGSRAVVRRVLDVCCLVEGVRVAEPGEFTRRALENGKLNLSQVEGLADLIDAQTELQRRQAVEIFGGSLASKVDGWRKDLIQASALLMAVIDFSDDDVPEEVDAEVLRLIETVGREIDAEVAGSSSARALREGFEVAIVGAPNVGKSTLLNAIADREVAITSEVAGTTRDVLEVAVDLSGLMVRFLDTAGLRETNDTIEAIGVSRAQERAEKADLRIYLKLDERESPFLELRSGDIVVSGKADLTGHGVSGLTGQGVEDVLARVGDELKHRAALSTGWGHERHLKKLKEASSIIETSIEMMKLNAQPEEASEMLRRVMTVLKELIGSVDVEDVLDDVFSKFCLGK
ncbi:MAG: tRNA uridine-5-carboxymethylaminomethyl(34) synthesis GTPase MnmE [Pseudomonadota bacterium]